MVTGANKVHRISGVSKAVRSFQRIIYPVSRIANAAGTVLLMAMMLFVTLDVVLRSLADITILGTVVYESVGFMMVIIVFLALAHCQVHKAHINIDMFVVRLPHKAQRVISSIMLLISLIFFILLTWQSVLRAFELRNSGTMSTALSIPTYPFLFVVAFGTAMLALVLLINFFETVTGGPRK